MAELLPHTYWAYYALGLGQRVKLLRGMRGLTQERLAEIAGVSRSLISNLERNDYNGARVADPTVSTIYRLAAALYVPPATLLPYAGEVVERHVIAQLKEPVETHEDVAFVMLWPTEPRDTARFADEYLRRGAPDGSRRFGGGKHPA